MGYIETMRCIDPFINEAEARVCKHLEQMTGIFPSASQLVKRVRAGHRYLRNISSAEDSQFEQALNTLRENHNEACVALELIKLGLERIEYEWQETPGTRTIDFLVFKNGKRKWVEVKTIHPKDLNDWEGYQRACALGLFKERTMLHLERNGLGGEIWHHRYASRSKMLEYSIDTEGKALSLGIMEMGEDLQLWFCGGGFRWRLDELEDFVSFYLSGRHRPDDLLGKMEEHYLCERGIKLQRSITHFGYVVRPDPGIYPIKVHFPVLPPKFPPR